MDPSEVHLRVAGEPAGKAPISIDLLKTSGEALLLDDKSIDTVVMTLRCARF